MSALARLLYPLPDFRRTPGSIVAWWERRRPMYNAVVGGTGLATLAIINLVGALPPEPRALFVPFPAIVVYAVMANLCYSGGWALNLLVQRLWGDEVRPIGPVLFRQGLIFSVGLTLLPVILAGADYAFRVLRAIL
jgi:hypothetical protein